MPEAKIPKEVQFWEDQFQKCVNSRGTFEEMWYLNMAFYFGKQHAQWDKGRLIEPSIPRHRVRLISNKIKPAIRREVTKLTKEEPQFYVVPNSTEPDDVNGAKVAENLADYVLDQSNFNLYRRRSTFWTSLCGTGYMKSYCTAMDAPITYEAPPTHSIYVPYLQIEDMERQPYVIEAKAVSCEEFYEAYGVEVNPDTRTGGGMLEQRFFNALGIKSDAAIKDLVFMKEIWVKPGKKYPKGALIIIADKKIAYAYSSEPVETDEINEELMHPAEDKKTVTDFPFEHKMYPYDKITHIPTGSFYGDSVIRDMIPLQKEYNRSRSQIIESKNRTAKPTLIYYRGSLEANKITSEPGLMIPIQPGFDKPEYLKQPDYPQYALQDLDRIQQDLDDTTNQFEVAKGRTPPGVEAASAIAYLQEENDDILHWTIAEIEAATASIGKKSLSLVQQFWTDEKVIQIVSKNNSYETMLFRASDVNNNVDLRVETQSMAPRSRAAKQAFITGLMKDGLIPPEKGMRYLQMNETNRLYEELMIDSKHAQRENFFMKNGEQVTINEFDNHVTHDYEHALFMKSQEYEQLPEEIKAIFLDHWKMHKIKLDTQMLIANEQGQEVPV